MSRSLAFTTQGRLHSRDVHVFLMPTVLNDTDRMELRVYADEKLGQVLLVARLDNLGKGASGAAVQNLRLMLGMAEASSLAAE